MFTGLSLTKPLEQLPLLPFPSQRSYTHSSIGVFVWKCKYSYRFRCMKVYIDIDTNMIMLSNEDTKLWFIKMFMGSQGMQACKHLLFPSLFMNTWGSLLDLHSQLSLNRLVHLQDYQQLILTPPSPGPTHLSCNHSLIRTFSTAHVLSAYTYTFTPCTS